MVDTVDKWMESKGWKSEGKEMMRLFGVEGKGTDGNWMKTFHLSHLNQFLLNS